MILLPEIPYNVKKIAEAIGRRSKRGSNFSIVAVAEGAMSRDDARIFEWRREGTQKRQDLEREVEAKREIAALEVRHQGNTLRLARQLRNSRISNPG